MQGRNNRRISFAKTAHVRVFDGAKPSPNKKPLSYSNYSIPNLSSVPPQRDFNTDFDIEQQRNSETEESFEMSLLHDDESSFDVSITGGSPPKNQQSDPQSNPPSRRLKSRDSIANFFPEESSFDVSITGSRNQSNPQSCLKSRDSIANFFSEKQEIQKVTTFQIDHTAVIAAAADPIRRSPRLSMMKQKQTGRKDSIAPFFDGLQQSPAASKSGYEDDFDSFVDASMDLGGVHSDDDSTQEDTFAKKIATRKKIFESDDDDQEMQEDFRRESMMEETMHFGKIKEDSASKREYANRRESTMEETMHFGKIREDSTSRTTRRESMMEQTTHFGKINEDSSRTTRRESTMEETMHFGKINEEPDNQDNDTIAGLFNQSPSSSPKNQDDTIANLFNPSSTNQSPSTIPPKDDTIANLFPDNQSDGTKLFPTTTPPKSTKSIKTIPPKSPYTHQYTPKKGSLLRHSLVGSEDGSMDIDEDEIEDMKDNTGELSKQQDDVVDMSITEEIPSGMVKSSLGQDDVDMSITVDIPLQMIKPLVEQEDVDMSITEEIPSHIIEPSVEQEDVDTPITKEIPSQMIKPSFEHYADMPLTHEIPLSNQDPEKEINEELSTQYSTVTSHGFTQESKSSGSRSSGSFELSQDLGSDFRECEVEEDKVEKSFVSKIPVSPRVSRKSISKTQSPIPTRSSPRRTPAKAILLEQPIKPKTPTTAKVSSPKSSKKTASPKTQILPSYKIKNVPVTPRLANVMKQRSQPSTATKPGSTFEQARRRRKSSMGPRLLRKIGELEMEKKEEAKVVVVEEKMAEEKLVEEKAIVEDDKMDIEEPVIQSPKEPSPIIQPSSPNNRRKSSAGKFFQSRPSPQFAEPGIMEEAPPTNIIDDGATLNFVDLALGKQHRAKEIRDLDGFLDILDIGYDDARDVRVEKEEYVDDKVEDYGDLEKLLALMRVKPELGLYKFATHQLSTQIQDQRVFFQEAAKEISTNLPILFYELNEAEAEEREQMIQLLKITQKATVLESKSEWFEWRKEMMQELNKTLMTNVEIVKKDQEVVDKLSDQVEQATKQFSEKIDGVKQNIVALKKMIADRENDKEAKLKELAIVKDDYLTLNEKLKLEIEATQKDILRLESSIENKKGEKKRLIETIQETEEKCKSKHVFDVVQLSGLREEYQLILATHLLAITKQTKTQKTFLIDNVVQVSFESVDGVVRLDIEVFDQVIDRSKLAVQSTSGIEVVDEIGKDKVKGLFERMFNGALVKAQSDIKEILNKASNTWIALKTLHTDVLNSRKSVPIKYIYENEALGLLLTHYNAGKRVQVKVWVSDGGELVYPFNCVVGGFNCVIGGVGEKEVYSLMSKVPKGYGYVEKVCEALICEY